MRAVDAWSAGLLAVLGGVALVLAQAERDGGAAGMPRERAEAWMLEALPGIGPVTARAWTARLRREGVGCLPVRARAVARRLFRD